MRKKKSQKEKLEARKRRKKIVKRVVKVFLLVLYCFLFFLSFALISSTNWTLDNYGFDSFNQILYTITSPVTSASSDLIWDFILENIFIPLGIVLCFVIAILIIRYLFRHSSIYFNMKLGKKDVLILLRNNWFFKTIYVLIPILLLGYSIYYSMDKLYIFDYIKSSSETSDFIELEYVDPKDVDIKFPNKKKNLIYIYLESMETTYMNKKNGGAYTTNYIPELTDLAKENLNFSYTDNLGGPTNYYGATWTMGGIVAATAGIPIKSTIHPNTKEFYQNGVVSGAYSLGDILEENGYHNYMMVGSDIEFGGRETYLTSHGDYTLYDYYTAIDEEVIDEDYYVWWGMEDDILFDWAKEKLTEISKKDEPFNFTMLTVDTHANEGYVSDFCEDKYDDSYLNAISCSSMQVAEFVDWIQKQDFYEDTTVILSGDHLSMNNTIFNEIPNGYFRSLYNVFLNSSVDTDCNKNRTFSTFDFFPTTLASLGAEIDGERLGLGTNLFSCKKTLGEIYGNQYINDNLNKTSSFYDDYLLNQKS